MPKDRVRDAFVGDGAKLYGGRWNSPDLAVVYGSQHKSLAVLEQLVHLGPRPAGHFKVFLFHFPGSLIEKISQGDLPKDWRQEPPPPSHSAVRRRVGTASPLGGFGRAEHHYPGGIELRAQSGASGLSENHY